MRLARRITTVVKVCLIITLMSQQVAAGLLASASSRTPSKCSTLAKEKADTEPVETNTTCSGCGCCKVEHSRAHCSCCQSKKAPAPKPAKKSCCAAEETPQQQSAYPLEPIERITLDCIRKQSTCTCAAVPTQPPSSDPSTTRTVRNQVAKRLSVNASPMISNNRSQLSHRIEPVWPSFPAASSVQQSFCIWIL